LSTNLWRLHHLAQVDGVRSVMEATSS
jgi:hypothetical protein